MKTKRFTYGKMLSSRVEENEVLSLDGNQFMVADNEIALEGNGGFAEKTAGAVIDQMHSMSRSSALTLFRLIDPTFANESISIKRFTRSIRLKHDVQDYIRKHQSL